MDRLSKSKGILIALLFYVGVGVVIVSRGFQTSFADESRLANVYQVNSELDAVDVNLGDGVCETADGTCTLRAAIQESNVTTTTDEINLPVGTFILTIAGTREDLAAFGDLDITAPVLISGVSAEKTIISGAKSERVFHNMADSVIANLTIRDGFNQDELPGAAIHNAAPLLLKNVSVTDNIHETTRLEAIYTIGDLTLENSLIKNNNRPLRIEEGPSVVIKNSVFRDNDGGAIYVWGQGGRPTVTILNSEIVDNTSFNPGVAIDFNFGTLRIDQTTIDNNRSSAPDYDSTYGNTGGLSLFGVNLLLTNSTVSNNHAGPAPAMAYNSSGGINLRSSQAIIKNTIIQGNVSNGPGGGVYSYGGTLEIENSSIINNQAARGGGIYVSGRSYERGSSFTSILNTTISGNVSQQAGGGILNERIDEYQADDSVVLLKNSSIIGNVAEGDAFEDGDGGGIWNNDLIIFYQTVVANNSAANQGADCFSVPVMHSLGYNLIEAGDPCPMSGDTATNITGIDALLGDLADNGGDMLTHLPQAGSPLIDAGNPAGCFDASFDSTQELSQISSQQLTFDQRGYYRTVDGNNDAEARCDIGAVEALSTAPILDQTIYLPLIRSGN